EIVVDGVSKAFGTVQALVDVHVRVRAGEFLSLIGPSGCGKTTLLKTIAGLVAPDSGRVTVGGRTVAGPGRECSVVFQDFALLPWATAQRNVEFGLLLRGAPGAERAATARRVLAKVGLAGFADAYPSPPSGGLQPRDRGVRGPGRRAVENSKEAPVTPPGSDLGRTGLTAVLGLLAAWEVLGRLDVSMFVPPVSEVAVAWWRLLGDGTLSRAAASSL